MKLFSYLMFALGTGSLLLGIYYVAKLSQGAGGLAAILPLFILVAFCLIGVLFFGIIGLISFLFAKKKK
ncbi:MAG: hypothetical protein Q7S83_01650 [bacterium]|nr:hypothetical protein [bacterium]